MTSWKLPTRLETDRLLLRPCLFDDMSTFVLFFTDVRATRFLLVPAEHKTPEGAETFFTTVLESYESDHPIFALAVLDRQSGDFVGFCGLAPVDKKDEAECFYAILPEFWGTGLATEATRGLLRHAFSDLGIQRVRAFVVPGNTAGERVAEKVGMRFDGKEKRDIHPDEGLIYAVKAEEFTRTNS